MQVAARKEVFVEHIEAVFLSIASDFLAIVGWAWPVLLIIVGQLIAFGLVMRVVDRGKIF